MRKAKVRLASLAAAFMVALPTFSSPAQASELVSIKPVITLGGGSGGQYQGQRQTQSQTITQTNTCVGCTNVNQSNSATQVAVAQQNAAQQGDDD